ncbi:MAG TPA: hypothetical protein VFL86_27435 [Burkholderiaceae bacterium]|nr:hypothetical protein [Burkholderiaceae bacterium]
MTGGRVLWFAACMAASAAAQAGQVYGSIGLPGVMAGYAQPFGGFTLRGDLATLRVPDQTVNEEGITYTSDATLNRLGLFADWFALGGWRLTGGITFNQMNLDLHGQGNGGVINIGGTNYTTSPDDRFDVQIEFPKTTPYLGLGYGHQAGSGGFGFVFDLGASIGRAKLSATASGPNLGQASQADIDRELEELRNGVGKVRFFPQLSLGLTYRF